MSGTAIILMTHRMYPQSGLGEEGSSTLVALVRLMIRIWSILMRLHMNFKLALFFKSHAALIALLNSHGCNIVQIAVTLYRQCQSYTALNRPQWTEPPTEDKCQNVVSLLFLSLSDGGQHNYSLAGLLTE